MPYGLFESNKVFFEFIFIPERLKAVAVTRITTVLTHPELCTRCIISGQGNQLRRYGLYWRNPICGLPFTNNKLVILLNHISVLVSFFPH